MNTIMLVNTGITEEFNSSVVEILKRQKTWFLSQDEYSERSTVSDEYSDSGMLIKSYGVNYTQEECNKNYNLNIIGDLIFKTCIKKQKLFGFTNIHLERLLWNLYNKGSTGVKHRDIPPVMQGKYASIVYYFNTCDGGTVIEDQKIDSVAGNAVFFNSKATHYGIGPTKDKHRFVLNMVFKYENMFPIEMFKDEPINYDNLDYSIK